MALYKLNFPIVTPEAYAFWESRHKLNRIKAIIAFSLDLDNANDNLRRKGYYRQYRKRYVELYKELVAHPDMQGPQFEFSGPDDYWWDPKVPPSAGPVVPVNITFAASDVVSTFSGINGSGTGSFTTTKNVTLSPTSATGLSNGGKVTLTVTPKRTTDTVNGKATDTVDITVSGLIPALAWNAHPTTGTIGTDLDFSWTGGTAPFTVVVLNPAGTEHDRATHTSPYTLKTTNQASGEWTITVEDSSSTKQTVTQKVQMAAAAPAPAPVFSAQPGNLITYTDKANPPVTHVATQHSTLYTQGSPLSITGAATANPVATAYQWQKQQADKSWADVGGATSVDYTVATSDATHEGTYRLMAVNGNSAPAYSDTVMVVNTHLSITADGGAGVPQPVKVDDTHYTLDQPAGNGKFLSPWLAEPASETRLDSAVLTAIGLPTGRAPLTRSDVDTTDDGIVHIVSVSPYSGLGQTQIDYKKAGKATVTFEFENIKSEVEVTVS